MWNWAFEFISGFLLKIMLEEQGFEICSLDDPLSSFMSLVANQSSAIKQGMAPIPFVDALIFLHELPSQEELAPYLRTSL